MLYGSDEHGLSNWLNILGIDRDLSLFVYGPSAAMRSVERVITDIAPTEIPILLIGESGTGKEVAALEIHRQSRRCKEAFFKCNCAGLSGESLLGHFESRDPNGPQAPAGSGTIFLDDVGQLTQATQIRLLQLLAGSDRTRPGTYMGARVISATTPDIEEQMRNGNFKEELYYRINGVSLRLPALRHRSDDIPALLVFFIKKYSSLFDKPELRLDTDTLELLSAYPWPGNIRELENFARKVVAMGDERLALSDLATSSAAGPMGPPFKRTLPPPAAAAPSAVAVAVGSLKEASREASRKAEHDIILHALERTHWNRKKTARQLQISYKALLYKIKQLGLSGTNSLESSSGEI